MCRTARAILQGEHAVGRVIARPFIGTPGAFSRTPHRHDFSLEPFDKTLLDNVKSAGQDSISVGKIWDVFAGRGITRKIEAETNDAVMRRTLAEIQGSAFKRGLLFANLVDFDMLYNHREDPRGSAAALEEFDRFLPGMMGALKEDDVLVLAADHGNDPTDHSTDHSREYVPVLLYGKKIKPGIDLGVRKTFADCGQTLASFLGVPPIKAGESFAGDILL
jgi:phosphopentomutase